MKKLLAIIIMLMTFITSPVYALERVGINNYLEQGSDNDLNDEYGDISESILKRMEKTLLTMPVGKNVNYNFIYQMIILHSEEIQLSIAIQGYTDNAQVIQYANDLLAAENGELREMRIVRRDLFKDKDIPSDGNSTYLKESKDLIKERFNNLYKYDETGNPEKDYLNIMVLNNEADITLANDYLKYGDNDLVKKIAENIINVKTEQIKQAKELLNSIK